MVSALDRQSRFRGEREIVEVTVLDRHATAEHYGGAYSRTRAQRDDSGHSCPARADAGIRSSLVAGNGSCGNRNQTAVEKHLRRTENKTRPDLGREEFLPRVLEWQDKHGRIIIEE